ncbi:hypothetical protein [Actinoplanes sp. ATCC 53533]|uniref:hypothetical protein n=1 Tax=Actinoplanes sp. ATCC 53533 TaxID=1288362 RepID=UPI001315AAA3|nr:hypothetical protein [Actinoplanes sp. ATCC 53533]
MYAPILSLLDADTARAMSRDRRWPKWSTQCLMSSLGLPTLDACLVTPEESESAGLIAEQFARIHDTDSVMVRSDGGIETSTYLRGGHTLPVSQAAEWARSVLAHGRAALFLEPTNRFTNALTAMMRIDRTNAQHTGGQLTVELLGAGFDLADLARSGIPPHARLEVHGIDWERPGQLWPSDIVATMVDSPTADRIEARLAFIGSHCLPERGRPGGADAADEGRNWVQQMGYTQLFQPFDLGAAVHHLPAWYADAYSIVAGLADQSWDCVATGWSDLGTGRNVYWDVIDGGRKYVKHH